MKGEKTERVLLDFYSEGCAPCKSMDKIISSLAEEPDFVEVRKIEASEAPEIFDRYDVERVPTLVFLKDGKERGRISGVCGKRDVERLVTEG